MDRLVRLFKDADEKTSWVRVPIINYLRACPKPEAKKYIEELKEVDPDAVKRASTFFPFGGSMGAPDSNESSAGGAATDWSRHQLFAEATWGREPTERGEIASVSSTASSMEPSTSERAQLPSNPFHLVGVLWLAGVLLMFCQWRILAGAGRRH